MFSLASPEHFRNGLIKILCCPEGPDATKKKRDRRKNIFFSFYRHLFIDFVKDPGFAM